MRFLRATVASTSGTLGPQCSIVFAMRKPTSQPSGNLVFTPRQSEMLSRFKSPTKQAAILQAMLCLICCILIWSPRLFSARPKTPVENRSAAVVRAGETDPNKADSELNHHLSGYALVAIGALIILGESSERLRFLRRVWPALFIAAGLFLAAWSDGEIWPRGDISWAWLIHHDLEARQHKIYSLLLIIIGMVEYARTGDKLPAFGRTWAFPLLALFGAGLLLFHDHTGSSGASSPEALSYRVRWSLGLRATASASTENARDPMPATHHDMSDLKASLPNLEQAREYAGDDSGMEMLRESGGHQHHLMTAAAMRVEKEHLWFALAGLAVGLFKFVSDGKFWRRSFVAYLWPSFVTLLGLMLVLYIE
jgi:hypothetical protein